MDYADSRKDGVQIPLAPCVWAALNYSGTIKKYGAKGMSIMDTTEQLNGTYFYGGLPNLTAGELFFWIFLDKVDEHFLGIKNITAVACILLG